MNRARLQKRHDRDVAVKKEAVRLFGTYRSDPLFLSGVMIYWAEGTRLNQNYRKYQLAFTNSDAGLLNFYCKFLRIYFKDIDNKNWRAGLFLYPDINPEKAKCYWSQVLSMPRSQFIKSQILNSSNKQNRKLKFGTCCVYVNSKDACLTMQAWIDAVNNYMRR